MEAISSDRTPNIEPKKATEYNSSFSKFEAAKDVEQTVDEDLARVALNPTEWNCFRHCSFLMYTTIVASCGGIIFGYDTAGINGILIMPAFLKEVGRTGLTRAEWANKESWIVASLLLACFFGAPFAAVISDRFGRKWSIMAAFAITTVGSAIQAGLLNYEMMIAGRVICGFGIGILSGVVPTYLAEVTPVSIRGSVGSFFYLTLACGILAAHLITQAFNTYALQDNGEHLVNNWRYILGIQGIMALVLILFMLPLEESPRWLVKANQIEKARKVLSRTRWALPVGLRKDAKGDWKEITNIDLELDEIVCEVKENEVKETAWYDFMILFAPDAILRTTMGILIQFFQQLCGINAFFYYSSLIFRDLNIKPDTTTSITGAVSVVATLICSFYIEKIGRRPLQIWGSIGMGGSLVIVGSIIFSSNVNPNQQEKDLIIVFICLYIVHFSYSYGPIAWLYPPETYPLHLRAKGASISTSANWLADFAVAKSVPEMILPGSSVGGVGGLFFFYAGWCLIMTIWAIYQMHETMNLSLEHVDPVFGVSNFSEW
eukprot:CAMPEP_0119036800 /NCGR_PEP_ID=MMETSP1177-20130426/4751_1 /TAXON_ID=2985 /ORGANISM="Ochromonas sp, Strain CCMP1899" /LENGTH=545 /DNA_ID=CAMNT_0006997177 /DNA_START=355 /DNA_END=1989 /DNA_ORIENTATION=+